MFRGRKECVNMELLCMLLLAADPGFQWSDLVTASRGSVVELNAQDGLGRKRGQGSGFLVSADGRVVTNHHVIDGAARIIAVMANGDQRKVEGILATDQEKDIAIIKLEGTGFQALALGESGPIKPGDEIAVIGSPRGYSGTLSTGIVSAVREKGLPGVNPQDHHGGSWRIQITAPISPGSSGSPVMTRDGKVIAVAVGVVMGAQNINFAVPIEVATQMLAALAPDAVPTPLGSPLARNLIISAVFFGLLAAGLWAVKRWDRRRLDD